MKKRTCKVLVLQVLLKFYLLHFPYILSLHEGLLALHSLEFFQYCALNMLNEKHNRCLLLFHFLSDIKPYCLIHILQPPRIFYCIKNGFYQFLFLIHQ